MREEHSAPSNPRPVGAQAVRLHFGTFELERTSGRLSRRGTSVDIDPKPLAVLECLLAARPEVVARDALRETVWPGVVVSDAAIASAVRDLRRALGDAGSRQHFVQTVRGGGYRFAAAVEEFYAPADAEAFVGRRLLLEQLDAGLAAIETGAGGCFWIAGDPGIGKSRLLIELARRATQKGITPLHGAFLEESEGAAYRPWQQILRKLLAPLSCEEVAARYGELAADALVLLPERQVTPSLLLAGQDDGRAARIRLFDAVTTLLASAAREQPTLLLLDDAHRADIASAELLHHLVRELPGLPVLIVAAYRGRELEAGHPIEAALGETRPGVAHLVVEGLEENEVAAVAGAVTGAEVPDATVRRLHGRTGGNPLFVRELARASSVIPGPPLDQLGTGSESILPTGLRHAIRGHLSVLSMRARRVLERAAVIGREVDTEILVGMSSQQESDACIAELGGLVRAGILEPVQSVPGRYRFLHILVRDAVYESIPAERRPLLHAAAGRAIEQLRAGQLDLQLESLAHHFGQSVAQGEAERAYRYARRAGEAAHRQAAWEDAIRLFTIALRALDAGIAGVHPASVRADLLVLLGRTQWRAGDTPAARGAFLHAAKLAEESAEAEILARAALGFAGRTDAEPIMNLRASTLLDRALAALPGGDSALRCEVLARLGTEHYYAPDPSRCDDLTREALEMAERLNDREILAYALSARAYALFRPETPVRRRLALQERMIALAGSRHELRASGLQDKVLCLMEEGDVTRLDGCMQELHATAAALRQPFFLWLDSAFRGTRALMNGRLEQAEQLAEETLTLGESFGTPNAFAIFAAQILYLRREQGRMAELEPALRGLLDGGPAYRPFLAALPPMYLEADRPRDARDALTQVMARDLDDLPRNHSWIPALALLAGACAELGEERWGRRLYELLLPYEGRMVVVGHGAACDGAVSYHLARAAVAFGDLEQAQEHLEAAVMLERRAGARLLCTRSQGLWAALLWKSGAPHEREHARELVGEASETCEALGLPDRARAIERVLTD